MNDKQQWFLRRARVDSTERLGGERRRPRHRVRPEVLVLEERRLLSLVIPVTSPGDSGPGTLRDAVATADQANQPVEFQFQLEEGATIALTSGQLELNNVNEPVAIEGPGALGLTIDGTDSSRIFQIDPGVTASITGITLADGNVGTYLGLGDMVNHNGGDLLNEGALSLTGVAVRGGFGYAGGDLFSSGTATLVDSTLADGTANRGAGLFISGSTTLNDCLVTGNTGVPAAFPECASVGGGCSVSGRCR
jgi:hypothetical protein